jgi:hypothetical protein
MRAKSRIFFQSFFGAAGQVVFAARARFFVRGRMGGMPRGQLQLPRRFYKYSTIISAALSVATIPGFRLVHDVRHAGGGPGYSDADNNALLFYVFYFPFMVATGIATLVFLAYWQTTPPTSVKWRFSLRTLLIATTLIAVVLGLIVWAAK